jgi:hypothetical protein
MPFAVPTLAPEASNSDEATRVPNASAPDTKLSQCVLDILDVLEKAGRPMTTMRILSELDRAGKEWSHRHVAGFLAAMVKDGTLLNPTGGKPAGYRLPEWE